MKENKYYQMLSNILENGREQQNRKGGIRYLTNEVMRLDKGDLLDIFEGHGIARRKLKSELELFCRGERNTDAYQRSSDASLGLPSDIYHLYLISRQVELPLHSITLFLGNVHIYQNNIENTKSLLDGKEGIKFELNV